jgi:ADP-L-glycero-D-manno-heptose 6-epimerase
MIVVTGGAGFIGGNLARSLAADGLEVVVVDDEDHRAPGRPLEHVDGIVRWGQAEFRERVTTDPSALDDVDAVLHQGACSSTTEAREDFLDDNNTRYSSDVLRACSAAGVPMIYASSAAVYGPGPTFEESPAHDQPLNAYARSKARFDDEVRALGAQPPSQVVGLRYFNVYGPGERHKGVMASQVMQLADQVRTDGRARIFGAGEGAGPGGHRRDFIHVDDVVAVVRWFLEHPDRSGIFNCGTGESRTFGELASIVCDVLGRGTVEFVDFPPGLHGRYQSFTEADTTRLRGAGCTHRFCSLEDGIARYLAVLDPPP